MPSRGIRNNNPGNIRKGPKPWLGEIPGTDKEFCTFDTPEHGIRAMAVILRNYRRKYFLDTVREIISRWAPPHENDTGAYVDAVSGHLQVAPDDEVNVLDTPTMVLLLEAIIRQENGSQPYTQEQLRTGATI